MYKIIGVALITTAIFFSCTKNTPGNIEEILPQGTVLVSGSFVNNVHPTSGTVKLVRDGAGKKYLVFENFRSDNGPDLRVWASPNTNASPYTEIGALKAVTGSFFYEIPASVNESLYNRVLIWCEDFSVLFGHAVLR